MAKLYNLARMTTSTIGTGTITLNTAVAGCLSFDEADVQDGDTVSYGIIDGDESEVGRGVYTTSGTTLTRSVLKSTDNDSAISLTGNAEVFITALAQDINFTVTKKTILTKTVIEDETLTEAGSFDFQDIPQTYEHLQLITILRNSADDYATNIRFNNDSGTNYTRAAKWYGTATGTQYVENADTASLAYSAGSASPSNYFGTTAYDIYDYADTTRYKNMLLGSIGGSTRASSTGYGQVGHCTWRNTAAISRITISGTLGNLAAGSRAILIGIKEESVVTDVTIV